jgi:hypothetical protein
MAETWDELRKHTYRPQPSPRRKLTDEQAAKARERYAAGESVRSLARDYGITDSTLVRLLSGWTYRASYEPRGVVVKQQVHQSQWTFDASARIAADLAWRDRDRQRSAANREREDAIIASWNAEMEPDYSAPLESAAA